MGKIITYQLYIQVKKEQCLEIGKLGKFNFPAGVYVYTGSAKKNMKARIARHKSKDKKLRWHIDYLLTASDTNIIKVKLLSKNECSLNKSTAGEIIVNRFGASDCKKKCKSHLKFLGEEYLNE